ncbi:MAG TPA: glycosyltransferase [Chloroflexota bacterium]|nr:glycosyltransferase [Chloroflexota bacterium]
MSGWLVVVAQAIGAVLAERNYRALPALHALASHVPADCDHVSIVVPCRDEARSLPALLASLAALDYPSYDVLVVDDGSSDGTGDVARAAGVSVVRVDELPAGWTGKAHSCWVGASRTTGEWVLFTDADTEHEPDSLHLAVGAARQLELGLLSLLARQRCETFWERMLLPYAYLLYFAGAATHGPRSRAIANGQYMLFTREAYDRLGGHAAVRSSLIEDVALARECSRRGIPLALARADSHLHVRMYSSLANIWEGFGKNAGRFVAMYPLGGAVTAAVTLAFSLTGPGFFLGRRAGVRLGLLVCPALALLPWLSRFGVPKRYALFHPISSLVFQLLAVDSLRRALPGRTRWKGRSY